MEDEEHDLVEGMGRAACGPTGTQDGGCAPASRDEPLAGARPSHHTRSPRTIWALLELNSLHNTTRGEATKPRPDSPVNSWVALSKEKCLTRFFHKHEYKPPHCSEAGGCHLPHVRRTHQKRHFPGKGRAHFIF